MNRLLDLAFELTLMAYADVINTNHSLIHALNKFVNGNDRVGNVEMDLLFGTVLGEYRTHLQIKGTRLYLKMASLPRRMYQKLICCRQK